MCSRGKTHHLSYFPGFPDAVLANCYQGAWEISGIRGLRGSSGLAFILRVQNGLSDSLSDFTFFEQNLNRAIHELAIG